MITKNGLQEDENEFVEITKDNSEGISVPQKQQSNLNEAQSAYLSEKILEKEEQDICLDVLSCGEILDRMEKIINRKEVKICAKEYIQMKDEIQKRRDIERGESIDLERFQGLNSIFREQYREASKMQEETLKDNLEVRNKIIEKLKNLYTNAEVGTNFFKAIREIKSEWANAGQIARADFKNVNNNYFHHLNSFYQMLDLNREYREQEYAHNLKKRYSIIARSKELLQEPFVQKALNELQYLHKLWKEEGEPVAEEFRDKTWQEFKEISNKIHDRKAELQSQTEASQEENLVKKNEIIEKIRKYIRTDQKVNHSYWQDAIKNVEKLRIEFLRLGAVPKKYSNHNWTEFKETLRAFNTTKNEFYKGLKGLQQDNLEKKLQLLQTAQDNMNSEEWDTAVPLFKKLQEEWKEIGHVPRNRTDKIWADFKDACNIFFRNFREKNTLISDDWKENYRQKKEILEELRSVGIEEGSVEKIEQLKTSWNSLGKVPRDKIGINSQFNKLLKEKLKMNRLTEFDLREEGLSESQLTDKARKVKNQIADLESEIALLENNLSFFSNPTSENLLLKDTFERIKEKKQQADSLRNILRQIIGSE